MTQLTTGAGFSMDNTAFSVGSLFSGTFSNSSSTSFQVETRASSAADYIDYFTGLSLSYGSNGEPNGGTLTGLSETLNGSTVFDMTGFAIDAATFTQWVHIDDGTSALNAIFAGDDTLNGGNFPDILDGRGGNNVLMGGAGADTLIGSAGNDHLYGQSPNGGSDGADSIIGGAGMDYIQGNAGNDTLDGGDGPDRINGGANDDLITAGNGNDYANGNKGNDTIDGGAGDDSLRGGQDQDSISGGVGNDSLSGDVGDDTLIGGAGYDTVTGGSGVDRFQFGAGDASFSGTTGSSDVITDYSDGTDKIGLGFTVASVLSGSGQSSLATAATYAQQLFDGHSGTGEVAAIGVGSDTYLFFSSTGGATVDAAIKVVGVAPSSFDTADFL